MLSRWRKVLQRCQSQQHLPWFVTDFVFEQKVTSMLSFYEDLFAHLLSFFLLGND